MRFGAPRPGRAGCGPPRRGGSNGRVSSSSDCASSSDSRVAGSTGLPAPSVRSKEEPYLSLAEFMTDRHSVFHVTAAAKGERLDRMLAQNADLSRSRLKALILAGAVTIGGSTIRDPGHRVNAGDEISVDDPAGRARGATGRGHPARHRARGRRADRDRQAEGAGGASGRRKPDRHAGQRADRPLRREPFGHRRRETARHRAPAGQGHHRPDGGGEDRPRAPRAVGAVRRSRPDRAAGTGLSGLRLGRAGPAEGHDRRADRPPPARRATSRRCGRAGARPSPTGNGWRRTPATDGKPVASLLSCRLETGRTHQIRVHLAHIGHPLLGDDVYGPGFKTKAALLPPRPRARRSKRSAGRRCTPICWASSTRSPAKPHVPLALPGDLAALRRRSDPARSRT